METLVLPLSFVSVHIFLRDILHFSCFFLQVHYLLLLFYLFFSFLCLFPRFSISPHALGSTAQQPLNYSHQTTLCIFCSFPLHPSRVFAVSCGRLCQCMGVLVFACLSVKHECTEAYPTCVFSSVCAPVHVSLHLFLISLPLLPHVLTPPHC